MDRKGKPTSRSRNWRGRRYQRSVTKAPVTHKEAFGGRKTLPDDPPSHPQAPWNNLVITKIHDIGTTSQTGLVNVGDLVKWMMNQLDGRNRTFAQDAVISLKILSVNVWNITGNYITLAAWDFSSDTQDDDALGSWVDSGSKQSAPKLGYTWPMSNRQRALSNAKATTDRRVFTVHASRGDKVLQHIHVMWRPNAIEMTLTSQIANLDTLNKAIRAVAAVNSKMYNQMPGIIPFTGAAKVAIIPIPGMSSDDVISGIKTDVPEYIQEDVAQPSDNLDAAAVKRELLEQLKALKVQLEESESPSSSICEL